MALQDALAGEDGDIVASFDGDVGVHLDVRVHHDHVARLAGMHIVHIADAGGVQQGLADSGDLLLIDSAIHQVVQGVPTEFPTHFADHEAHNLRGNRVKYRITRQIADDAQPYDQ